MSLSQLTNGWARVEMTLEKPASLPPMEIHGYLVVALSEPIWLSSTSWVFAPCGEREA
jgi:hypothetical protein